MASTEPSSPSLPAPTPDSPSPVLTPAPVASPPPAAVAAIAVPGTRAGTALTLASANTGFDHIFGTRSLGIRGRQHPFPPPRARRLRVRPRGGSRAGSWARLLALSEAGPKKALQRARRGGCGGVVGLTHALSESYTGYFQCMYALNAAHSSSQNSTRPFSQPGATRTSRPPPPTPPLPPTVRRILFPPTPSLASLTPASASRNASSLSVSTVSDEPPASAFPAPAPAVPHEVDFREVGRVDGVVAVHEIFCECEDETTPLPHTVLPFG
ncbi:hypothetical protein C8R45DRAFT_1212945 [Mycena sanguinolenta]|nr:hypothetical protein C8R45DRAFT_1212945 [Mycena sanguinolenta]